MFTDEAFVNNLSVNNKNVFQKVYDEIKYLCKTVTAGSKEARQLEKVKRAFEKAYSDNFIADTNGDLVYSLEQKSSKSLKDNVQEIMDMTDEEALSRKKDGQYITVMDHNINNLINKRTSKVEYEKEDLSQVNPQLHKSLSTINDKSSNYNIPDSTKNVNGNIDSIKHKQFEVISKNNPANDGYHTWIRSSNDIKTFEETLHDDDWSDGLDFDPDYTWDMAQEALKKGEIKVHSSHPIKQGIFVTPSRMEAESYSGDGKVYSQTVRLEDVAWIDPTQGMYAKVAYKSNTKYSLTNIYKIEFAKNDIELYTEEQYNNYGWVRANKVLSAAEYKQFAGYFADHKIHNNYFVKTRFGESIIPVGKNSEYLVYSKGSIDNPKISKVITINENNDYLISQIRGDILDCERKNIYNIAQYVENIYGEGLLRTDYVRNFPTFQELRIERERKIGRDGNSNSQEFQDGTRSIEHSNEFESVKRTSSKDGVFFNFEGIPDSKNSLSKSNELPNSQGNYNIYGDDVTLDSTEDIAPIAESATPYSSSHEEVPDDFAPVSESGVAIENSFNNKDNTDKSLNEYNDNDNRQRRSEYHKSIIDNVKHKFIENGFDFDEVLNNAKNLSTFATVDNIPQRVMEKALGYKQGQILSDITVNKVAQNEAEGIKWINFYTDRKNGVPTSMHKFMQ